MYVIFEGVDTSGKSTQIELFKQRKANVLTTKEPGGTSLGLKLRKMLLSGLNSYNAELFMFLADRAYHYDNVVKNERDSKLILSDRGFLSGVAYALANQTTISQKALLEMNFLALNNTYPDKIVLFMTNKALIESRLGDKKKDAIEMRGVDYLLQIQDIMAQIAKQLPIKVLEVDAWLDIETIYKKIEDFLND